LLPSVEIGGVGRKEGGGERRREEEIFSVRNKFD
jgi:hypothetical protein